MFKFDDYVLKKNPQKTWRLKVCLKSLQQNLVLYFFLIIYFHS